MMDDQVVFEIKKWVLPADRKKIKKRRKWVIEKRREEKTEEYFLHVYSATLTTVSERR